MSVLVQGEGQQLLLTKGAPESVLGRCSSALANSEPPPSGGNAAMGTGIATSGRQVVPLTEGMRRSLLERMGQYGGAGLLPAGCFCHTRPGLGCGCVLVPTRDRTMCC